MIPIVLPHGAFVHTTGKFNFEPVTEAETLTDLASTRLLGPE